MEKRNDKIVIFDWGGVIESHRAGEYNLKDALKSTLKRLHVDIEDKDVIKSINRFYYNKLGNPIGAQNKKEEIDAWFEHIKEIFYINISLEEFTKIYETEFAKVEYYKEVVTYAHTLKENVKIGILSNLSFLDKKRLDTQVNLDKFDYVWLSFELNSRKPDEEIYRKVEQTCNLQANHILLIDDCKENIEMAKKRGWKTCNAFGYELEKIQKTVTEFLQS